MRGRGPIIIAVGVSLLCATPARAGVTILNFGDGPEEFMQGTVEASGYGACSGSEADGCFATYLYGYIRADDGSCPPGDGNPAVAMDLPRDGSAVTAAVDGDPAVQGWNRLCAYVERVYWSGVTAVIAQASAVAYSKGPVADDDGDDCSDCDESRPRQRLVLGPGGSPPPGNHLRLSAAEVRRQINRVLRRVFKRSFNKRGLSRTCRRRTHAKVTCRVAWRARAHHFAGEVAVRKVARARYRYSLRIRKAPLRGHVRLVKRRGSL